MASLRKKDRSPFWFACFSLADGTRTQRSTGATDRREAERIADQFEDAAREAAAGRLTEARARKVIADIYARATQQQLPSSTAGEFLDAWLARKSLEADPNTHERYATVLTQFKKHLGARLRLNIAGITAADIAKFRDAIAHRLTPATANLSLKIVRAAFAQARRDGLVDLNEAERVSIIKNRAQSPRRPFTIPELRRLLEVADEEWRGLILTGLYTGQRLGDLAALTWQNVDLQRGELRFVTSKTGRRQILPLAPPLLRYVEALPTNDQPDAPLFPQAAATLAQHGRTGALSNQFAALLAQAGLATKKSHHATPAVRKGRSAPRQPSELSFHCLRHTATSLLKNAGVSEAVAREFIGHDSGAVSARYTHLDPATLREAASTLPDITQ